MAVSYSTQRTTSSGSLSTLALSIEYLDRSEISVYINDVLSTAWTWAAPTGSVIQFTDAPLAFGTEVLVRRTTDLSAIRHIFSGGAQFTYSTLDQDFAQVLHIAQEAIEGGQISDLFSDLNMHQNSVVNVRDAVLPGDVVPFAQLQNYVAAGLPGWTNLGDYTSGLVFTRYDQTFRYEGNFYSPSSAIDLPYTTTGAGAAEVATFRYVGDAVLRDEIEPVLSRVYSFPATADMPTLVVPAGHTVFHTLGYRVAGDGGGATFTGPLLTDPGTVDSIEVGYGDSFTRRWFRIVHEGAVNLDQCGAYGDSYDIFDGGTFRDESVLLVACIDLAAALGLNKVVSNGNRGYGVENAVISHDVELDLRGSTLYGNFGAWGVSSVDGVSPIYWTRRMLTTSPSVPVSVTLRNFKINGQNSPSVSMIGGEIMLSFNGGVSPGKVKVQLIDGEITRGSNRVYTTGSGISVPSTILAYTNCDTLMYNCDEVLIRNVECRSSPAEMFNIQSDDARTTWLIEDCHFTKLRDGTVSTLWSSSAVNVFNCGPLGEMRNCVFDKFGKGPANIQTDGVLITGCAFKDVSDSSGLDFCEARSYRQNQITVRNCYFEDIPRIGIRSASNNILCEGNTFNRVNICHSFEAGVVGDGGKGAWLKADEVPLYNVRVLRPRYLNFSASHTDLIGVRALGVSGKPVHITVDGNGCADRPNTRAIYGIHATYARLVATGYHGEGRTAVIYMTGVCHLAAMDAVFAPEEGQSVHTILFEDATVSADTANISRCSRVTNLDAGYSDIRVVSGTMDPRGINVEQSPLFPAITNGVVQRDGELQGISGSYNPASVAAGASVATTVAVLGAAVGDDARAAFSINTSGLILMARVSSAGIVTVYFFNPTAAAIDIGGGVITAFVRQTR